VGVVTGFFALALAAVLDRSCFSAAADDERVSLGAGDLTTIDEEGQKGSNTISYDIQETTFFFDSSIRFRLC